MRLILRFISRLSTHLQQLSPKAHFTSDLDLDSLDAVEVVMAIEEVKSMSRPVLLRIRLTWLQEFSIEMPDKEADAIQSGGF